MLLSCWIVATIIDCAQTFDKELYFLGMFCKGLIPKVKPSLTFKF